MQVNYTISEFDENFGVFKEKRVDIQAAPGMDPSR